ncbi:hypothetical protein BaRGS_00038553 [Batillaria attramentaria]|uniref:CUB domain-containing protein n=1 Tax=Batillaria attramentaria TaxID=370345 RepID=A0ABD0J5S0_9CAEN
MRPLHRSASKVTCQVKSLTQIQSKDQTRINTGTSDPKTCNPKNTTIIVSAFRNIDEFKLPGCNSTWCSPKNGHAPEDCERWSILVRVSMVHSWPSDGPHTKCTCSVISGSQQTFNVTGLNICDDNVTSTLEYSDQFIPFTTFPDSTLISFRTDFEIKFEGSTSDTSSPKHQVIAFHLLSLTAEKPFKLTCSSPSTPPQTRKPTTDLVKKRSSTRSPSVQSTNGRTQTSRIPNTSPTGTSPTTISMDRNTPESDDNTIWVVVGAVGIGVVVIGASVAIAIVVYIRIKRGRNYERPLPRRQMEITMYTGLIPESLRERNLATVRNPDTASHIYSEVDEHRMRNMQVDGPSQPSLQQVSSQNQSEISRHQASSPMDDIETDDDGYLRPFARSQV